MEPKNQQHLIEEETYAKVPRKIVLDLFNSLIAFDEYVILLWLYMRANPHNGWIYTNYSQLEGELCGRYKKNLINKTLLSLKQKKYLDFISQQGRRSSFKIILLYFPLSNGFFRGRDIKNNNLSRSATSSDGNLSAEVESNQQKLKEEKDGLVKRFSLHMANASSRSANNDIDNNKNNLSIDNFKPKTLEETRCLDIAVQLGERDIRFILSISKRYGMSIIEIAWRQFKEDEQKIVIKNKGAYFNKKVNDLINKDPP